MHHRSVAVIHNARHRVNLAKDYALHGAPMVFVSYAEDDRGTRKLGAGRLMRSSKAPFNPADKMPSPDDIPIFIDPFRPISAVWHLRLGGPPFAQMFLNPNAHIAIPAGLDEALMTTFPRKK